MDKLKKLQILKFIYLHAREIIEQLSLGNIDIGFSGYDLFKESEINIQKNKILIKKTIIWQCKSCFSYKRFMDRCSNNIRFRRSCR